MNIAILGWGSLVWDARNLQIKRNWNTDGPFLPVEFARISEDGRLTLVLYPDADSIQVLWAYSTYEELYQAKENLREREGTIRKRIGFISIHDRSCNCKAVPQILNPIRQWAEKKKLDAIIWTDFPSNFEEKTGTDFNEENVLKYLNDLSGDNLKSAENYVRRAPGQIVTKIRAFIEKEFGWGKK